MRRRVLSALPFLLSFGACGGSPSSSPPSPVEARPARTTEYVLGPATPDGIGKYYMGREISLVMGHLGADWLERDTREAEERTDVLLEFLIDQEGRVVADIGAGTGYFALPWAAALNEGRVLAVDIQPEMLAMIEARTTALGIDNVEPVLGSIQDPNLPAAAVDVVLIVDAYHEFSHPREMMAGIVRGLRSGGRLILVEYRAEDPLVPIKDLHRMSEAQAVLEVEEAGLEWKETRDFLPMQHVLVFEKP